MTLDEIKEQWKALKFGEFSDEQLREAREVVDAEQTRLIAKYGVKFDHVFEEISSLNLLDFTLDHHIQVRKTNRENHEEALRLQR